MMNAPEVVTASGGAVLAGHVRILQRAELQLAGDLPDVERPAILAIPITKC